MGLKSPSFRCRKSVSDRYYRVLYEKLLDHGINATSKRTMFLNLIYKSMKVDPSVNRVKVNGVVALMVLFLLI